MTLLNEMTKKVFLIVDDYESMRSVTSSQLSSMGVQNILVANNGEIALNILHNKHVDIVLSDWNMPVMTGLELLKAVRIDKKLSHLPFIMITAEVEREYIAEAIACGVSELIVKPFTKERLASRINKALCCPPRTTAYNAAWLNTLPIASTSLSTTQNTPAPKRPTLLVVDDMPDNLLMLSHLFKDKYRVRTAQSGEKALRICQANDPPDLVLLDIMMPIMDGFEVARRMREHPASASIPVIFVTAMTGENTRLAGLALGAIDFVSKPIDPDVLTLRVCNFMRYVGLHKQLQNDYDNMLEMSRLREHVERMSQHDMKGSLASVIGLIQELADIDAMNFKQQELLQLAENTALQVLNMINLSQELFKIETGRFTLDAKPIKIDDLLSRIAQITRTRFADKDLSITVNFALSNDANKPLACGDAMFCYSLFQNLINNACEAAPNKSQVLITLTDETPLRILIKNTGAVPAEIRETFFNKFVTQGKQGGTGIGTYSAKLLAEAQNGTVALEVSDLTNETTLIVSLPRNDSILLRH